MIDVGLAGPFRPLTLGVQSQEEAGMVRFGWEVPVECYEGYRGEEEPRRFEWAGQRLEITEILDRWLDPTHRYFKVRTRDGGVHLLRHDSESGRWEVRGVTEPDR